MTLPGLNGLELQRQLADRADMPIIFITGHGDVPMSVQAMKAGAVEFLTKPFKDDVLLDAIRGAIERSRVALRHDSELRVLRDGFESLTPREREVMALVVSGLLNKQVGGELGISEITVKAHRGQVMRKMKADSLPDLVTMARASDYALRRDTDSQPTLRSRSSRSVVRSVDFDPRSHRRDPLDARSNRSVSRNIATYPNK